MKKQGTLPSIERKDLSDQEYQALPRGTIIRRKIRGIDRFYHQWREDGRTRSRYLRADEVLPLRQQIERRKEYEQRLKAKSLRHRHQSVPTVRNHDLISELATGANQLKRQEVVREVIDFIVSDTDARILLIKGLPGSGQTTVLLQALGELSPSDRARLSLATCPLDLGSVPGLAGTVPASGPVRTIDLSVTTYRTFAQLSPAEGLDGFLQRGGLPNGAFRDSATARKYLDGVAGANAWTILEELTVPFIHRALLARTAGHAHGRTRESSDVQRVLRQLAVRASAIRPDPATVRLLRDLGFLAAMTRETLRPELRHEPTWTFNHPGLRHAVALKLTIELLEDAAFATLGAAERKMVRDTLMAGVREHLLEEVVLRETLARATSDSRQVVPIALPSGRTALLMADRDELVCELFVIRHAETRSDEQLADLSDPHLLDAVEHRYGTVTDRTVLYLGRNARHPLGFAYRNVEKFLLER